MAQVMLDMMQRFFHLGVAIVFNTARVWVMNVETHHMVNAILATPEPSNASIALVSTGEGVALESDKQMKPMSNRPKTQAEQCLFEVLSKLGQAPGESGTINVDAVSALGQMEHQIDDLTRQRDELLNLAKSLTAWVRMAGGDCITADLKIREFNNIVAAERGQK